MKIMSKFVMDDVSKVDAELMDGFGELINIIAGAADGKIQDLIINLTLPTILLGDSTKFFANAAAPFFVVPMKAEGIGKITLSVSLNVIKQN